MYRVDPCLVCVRSRPSNFPQSLGTASRPSSSALRPGAQREHQLHLKIHLTAIIMLTVPLMWQIYCSRSPQSFHSLSLQLMKIVCDLFGCSNVPEVNHTMAADG